MANLVYLNGTEYGIVNKTEPNTIIIKSLCSLKEILMQLRCSTFLPKERLSLSEGLYVSPLFLILIA